MPRLLTTELCKLAHRWSARPMWAASLGILLVTLIFSGPLACLVHCAVVDEPHGGQHHAHHADHSAPIAAEPSGTDSHPLLIANQPSDQGSCHALMDQLSDAAPSALTIGVVLVTIYLPLLGVAMFRRLEIQSPLRLLSLPPPLDPPKYAPSLTF